MILEKHKSKIDNYTANIFHFDQVWSSNKKQSAFETPLCLTSLVQLFHFHKTCPLVLYKLKSLGHIRKNTPD